MATPYLIPLQPQNQLLAITLAGVQYRLKVKWNQPNQSWVLDIMDSSGNPLVTGIAVVPGTDLLAQYGYMNFGGQLIAQTTNDPDAVPTYEDLGTTGCLYFVVPASS